MDGSIVAHLAATYGAGVVPALLVGWALLGHVRECAERRRRLHADVDQLRADVHADIERLRGDVHADFETLRGEVKASAADVGWIRGKLDQ